MHTLSPLPKKPEAYSNVISEKVVSWHHDKHQAGYVNKLNEICDKLKTAAKADSNPNYSEWGELKRRESFNHAGVILHEIYWNIFGSDGTSNPEMEIVQKITEDFGSMEAWREDFIATGKSALGWVVLIWDSYSDKLKNVSVDYHNNGAFWNSIVLLACDVFEHAYYFDFGPDRAAYLDKFVLSIDWKEVNLNYIGEDCDCGECEDCKNRECEDCKDDAKETGTKSEGETK
jgi:Fe-Mn family superoxide dismutase